MKWILLMVFLNEYLTLFPNLQDADRKTELNIIQKYIRQRLKQNLIIFPCLRVFISFLMRGYIGFSVGKDSTEVCLSEIIYTFSRPLGHRRKNRAKYNPKMILAKFEIELCQNLFLKYFFTLNHIYIYSSSSHYQLLNR